MQPLESHLKNNEPNLNAHFTKTTILLKLGRAGIDGYG